ncbi:carboxylesterase family protein [Streptomyces caniscabiei]|uniref:Carboxylic ester hydrolase n=1 Tax=Streptomyces caniscabiei TaxID=2746961 RepID=A0A927L405_9ACTN|nr:carboxylesterase family protein [Streptomyces caniscabiei]MBD9724909.1 carboxylesterase family protein [Streptomyces caniscabiei]MDX3510520.1 carboxylesterase family protein [Streptomyces caniscabiei]MDX3720603.1 carboxylesterase family protein [Streptomyces caniscabiei]WEO26114.1 carboxylesterase family protein [Streptomyces caniscabiei]
MTSADGLVVRTVAGAVRGREEGGLTVFRGIPFAEPPVGEARFGAPRPASAWEGTREAYAFGPPPPQESGFQGRTGTLDVPAGDAGDDWLTVNVWTPEADPAARRPVMVWIYGGAYKLGHSGSPGYDARHLARAGDLVVVTFNYRVGIEGFASFDGAPANRGLLDQVAALEWVRDNITAFGGDPGQVTVFGESAGAGSVASLLAMPRARGLFRRAVAQSVPSPFFSDELARDIAAEIAEEAGLPPTAAALSTVDPRQLTSAGEALGARMAKYEDRWGQAAPTVTPFSPVVDGDILPCTPWEALAAGAARDVELMVGHNRDEYQLFLVLAGQLDQIGEDRADWALRTFAPGPDGARAYRAAYPHATPSQLYVRVQTDWLFSMPTVRLAEAQIAGGGRAHVYELTWPAPGYGGVLGACHGLDIPLLFGTYEADLGQLLFAGSGVPPEARALTDRFQTSWTAFARTGEPGWPAYEVPGAGRGGDGGSGGRLTQVLDVEPEVRPYPEEVSRRLWEGHEFTALPLLR